MTLDMSMVAGQAGAWCASPAAAAHPSGATLSHTIQTIGQTAQATEATLAVAAAPLADASQACGTQDTGLIATVTQWLVDMMTQVGGPGVGLAIALESIFPPIPSEVVLPLAGFTAAMGRLSFIEALIWATIGSLVGAWVLYGIAHAIGAERIERIADRIPGASADDVRKANAWFTRWGSLSVLLGRVIPVVRSLISIPAGVAKMGFLRFTCWTLLGSAVWNLFLIGAGYTLGDRWCDIQTFLDRFELVVLALIAVAIVALAVRWAMRIARARHGGGEDA